MLGAATGDMAPLYINQSRGYNKVDFSGCNSAVECLLPKQDVVGSNPITRSMKLKGKAGVLDVSEVVKVAHHCMYRPEGSPEVTGEVPPAEVQDGVAASLAN